MVAVTGGSIQEICGKKIVRVMVRFISYQPVISVSGV